MTKIPLIEEEEKLMSVPFNALALKPLFPSFLLVFAQVKAEWTVGQWV